MASRVIQGALAPLDSEMMTANERDRFDLANTGSTTALRLLGRYRFTIRPFFSPFTWPLTSIKLARMVERRDALEFSSIRCWLLRIVTLALDSDPLLLRTT